jgi:hypothetical protein
MKVMEPKELEKLKHQLDQIDQVLLDKVKIQELNQKNLELIGAAFQSCLAILQFCTLWSILFFLLQQIDQNLILFLEYMSWILGLG